MYNPNLMLVGAYSHAGDKNDAPDTKKGFGGGYTFSLQYAF